MQIQHSRTDWLPEIGGHADLEAAQRMERGELEHRYLLTRLNLRLTLARAMALEAKLEACKAGGVA